MNFTIHASSSSGNCYTIDDSETRLMIECGLTMNQLRKKGGPRIRDLQGCLVTHDHGDHSKGIKELIKMGIDVYASQGTFGKLGIESHRAHVVKAKRQFKVGSFTVMPFNTVHDSAEPLGFIIASGSYKLLFLTDSHYCPIRVPGLTMIAVEANYSKETLQKDLHPVVKRRLMRSHMSLERVLKMLKANDLSKVQHIYLLHLSDGNSDAEMFKKAVMAATGLPVTICGK